MADGTRLRYDGVETYLANQLDVGVTTVEFTTHLTSDGGGTVDTFVGDEYLALSILDANYRLKEIVHLVAYDALSLTGTIERGQEGTIEWTHPAGNKVVHSATVYDYVMVQDHATDPSTHPELIDQCNGYTDTAIANHNDENFDDSPHPYFAKKAGDTFTGPVVFDDVVTFNSDVTVAAGSVLNIEGDLNVTGRLFINGKEIVVSNTGPTDHGANTVWIQTFG